MPVIQSLLPACCLFAVWLCLHISPQVRCYCAVPAGLQNLSEVPPAVYGGRHTVTLIPGLFRLHLTLRWKLNFNCTVSWYKSRYVGKHVDWACWFVQIKHKLYVCLFSYYFLAYWHYLWWFDYYGTLLGDGIGPELAGYVKEAIRFCGAPVDFEEIGVNRESSEDELENAILAVSRNGVGLKGMWNVPCKIAYVSCVYNSVAYYALNIMLCNAALNPKKLSCWCLWWSETYTSTIDW